LRLIVEILRKSIDSPYPIARLLAYIPLPGTELFEISQQHGFRSPTTIEGWTDFDYMNFRERRYKVRPWLTDDLVNYADEAIKKVAYTSVYFTGKGADKAKIDSVLENLLHFAK
jgi:hypothetical protein